MILVFLDPGVIQLSKNAFLQTSSLSWEMGLYKSSLTPSRSDSSSDYTAIECTFDGYSRVSMGAASYGGLGGHLAVQNFSQVTFTVSAPPITGNNVYGLFIYDTVLSDVVAAAIFDSPPLDMSIAGQQIKITLAVSDYSFYP